MGYHVHTGLIAGRSHILAGANCQDAVSLLCCENASMPYWIGVLADGCSQGKHAEVGAQLAVHFATEEVKRLLLSGVTLDTLPALLFERLLDFLREVSSAYHFTTPQEMAAFVNDYLLFTLLGCIVSEQEALVFTAGDGVVVINDTVHLLDQQNAPHYLGYHLVDRRLLAQGAASLPTCFDLYRVPAADLNRLAIGSDAWIPEGALLEQIWESVGAGELQMRLNRWSDARHLRDDASLIVVERDTPPENGGR